MPLPDPVAGWQAALDNRSPHASPCRYLAPAKWAAIRESGLDFCDRLGAEAHRLGWTAAKLFAVHPEHGTARIDACGVLMIGPEPARGVEVNRVRFERTSGYRNGPGLGRASLGFRQGRREIGTGVRLWIGCGRRSY